MIQEVMEVQQAEAVAVAEETGAQGLLAEAQAAVIQTPAEYEHWGATRGQIRAKLVELETKRTGITGPLNITLQRVNDLFRRPKEILQQVLKAIDGHLIAYQQEQERLRQDEERRAREKVLAEQKRLQDQADKRSAKLEEKGETDRAELVRASVPEIPLPVIPQVNIPKVQGLSTRESWNIRIVRPKLVPREYCVPDETALRAVAKAMKERFNIPGVEAYRDDIVASRRQ